MSNTMNIACHDCKEEFWAGQTDREGWYVYKDTNRDFARFLVRHIGHEVEIYDDYGGSQKCTDEYNRLEGD